MGTPLKPRWVLRFVNFKRAYSLLKEAFEIKAERPLTQLEKEGVIQRFEYTFELAKSVLLDYLREKDTIMPNTSAFFVLKYSFQIGLIQNGEIWTVMQDARNATSHKYDFETFNDVILQLENKFMAEFNDFLLRFMAYELAENP